MLNSLDEKIKILIVEDDVFIAESLMLTLQGLGYDVAEPCVTPQEALVKLETQSFDLALLDIQFFEKEEGIELGKIVSEKFKIPFIFLTAFSDAETVKRATIAKPSAYIIKPAAPAALFAAIQTALHNFHDQRVATAVESSEQSNAFFVKINSKIFRIQWEEIVSIESSKNYALIKSSDKKYPTIPIRGSLQQVLQLIPAKLSTCFVQINRGCCVNVNYVTQVNKDLAVCQVGSFVLGESYKKPFLEKLNILK